MKIHLALILVLINLCSTSAQSLNSTGARPQALANATGASISFWSLIKNPSNLVFTDRTSIGFDVKNNFMIKELSSATLAMIIPIRNTGNISFYFQRFGYEIYNENKIAISYSNRISEYASAGVQLSDNLQYIRTAETSEINHAISFNINLFAKLNNSIHLATHYSFEKTYTKESDNIQELSLALSWFPIKELNLLLEATKIRQSDISLRGGIEYSIINKVFARVGVSSTPMNVSLGIGMVFKSISIDISASHNQYLGTGSSISGNYNFIGTK
ncbi:MAG: hypothetical protein KAH10_07770 [Flavobacteriales bacterium]|nr:hypothetical protein [Flavobacteriales bacterium]